MSSGLHHLEERIAKLEAAGTALTELTREAHEAIKELRRVRREIDQLLGTNARQLVDAAIADQVEAGLDRYKDTIREQQEAATARHERQFEAATPRIERQFNELARLYLEGSRTQARSGRRALPDLALEARLRNEGRS